ncbi:hypothetical protein PMAC_000768 [Pneumocystis sp. 'macacae']|nr:hypothetical protein PMAC_000768 [Pneumocystis sp. 'macacae']
MNEYRNGAILTIAVYNLNFKWSFLSIVNGLFLFMPLTLIFPQKFKFLTRYLYSCIKNQKDILEANNDFLKKKKNKVIYSNRSSLFNHLHMIRKAFQTKSKLYNIGYKDEYQKKNMLLARINSQFLIKDDYLLIYALPSNRKQCPIKNPYAKKLYLQLFSNLDLPLYIFCESFFSERYILVFNNKINELLKSRKHNSFDISIFHYTSDNRIEELRKIIVLLKSTGKNSRNSIKILKEIKLLPKNHQNINKIIKIYKSTSTNQNISTSFSNNFNFESQNSEKKTFECQFIYHSTKSSLETLPVTTNRNVFSQDNTFSEYKRRSYKELPSKRNTTHPLSDIQNSCSKFSSASLYNLSFNITKALKDKQFDVHTHLKENVCPTTQPNIQGFTKDGISMKLTPNTSNTFGNNTIHFSSLAHEKKLVFEEQHDQRDRTFDNDHVSIEKMFFSPKINLLKIYNKKKSFKDIKCLPVNITDPDMLLPLLESSIISSRTSKYKQPKIFSPVKINNIYEDSLRLLKQIHDDNRRRGIPPCPPPIQKRWEFVENW